MEVVEGIELLSTLLTTVTNAAAQAATVSAVIKGAQAAGRTTFTDAEWATITATQATSRQALVDAIAKALAPK
jgi:hypothetical protein